MLENNIPLKYRIYDSLKQSIKKGEFKAGEMIPSEAELCEKYGVSRTTILAAIQMLQNDSLIIRKQGKGTFVSEPKFSRDLSSARNRFFGMMSSEKDIVPSTQILQLRAELIDSTNSQLLGVESNTKVVFLKRLRLIDNEPVAVTWSYMLWDYGSDLLQKPVDADFSITRYIQENYGQEPVPGTIKLTVEEAFGQDAHLMNIPEGFTCCKTVSTSYVGSEKFELAYTLMRADKFEFIIKRIDY